MLTPDEYFELSPEAQDAIKFEEKRRIFFLSLEESSNYLPEMLDSCAANLEEFHRGDHGFFQDVLERSATHIRNQQQGLDLLQCEAPRGKGSV